VTLSHVVRPHVLAASLDPERYDVTVACDPRFSRLFEKTTFARRDLDSITCDEFLHKLEVGSPVYDARTLRRYVDEDLALLRAVEPDVVVGDFRLSLSVSARLAGVPYLAVTDACWSPFSPASFPLAEHPMTKVLGVRASQAVFAAIRPVAFAYHCLPLNRVRRDLGLPSLGYELKRAYTDADWVLYADIPELAPLLNLPATHRYLGPIRWSPAVPKPAWWDDVPKDKPAVYVTFGVSGKTDLLPRVVEALSELPVSILVATAGRAALDAPPRDTFVADYLPGDAAAARSSLMICNGGTLTVQQALCARIPVLGLANNMNQHMNMQTISRAGAGELMRAGTFDAAELRAMVLKILSSPAYVQAASVLGQTYLRYDASSRFGEILELASRGSALREAAPMKRSTRRTSSVRMLEPKVKTQAEALAYDEMELHFGDILFQGLAESALNMGVAAGRMLEVGTGTGRVSIRLAKLNPALSIDAVDHTENNFRVARENARRHGLGERLRFSLARPSALPFPPKAFDLVIASNVLLNAADPLACLREIQRVARPEGAILVRDVRRLPAAILPFVVALYTRGFSPTLKRLASNSFHAALSYAELESLVKQLGMPRAKVRKYFVSHIGVEVPAATFAAAPVRPPAAASLFKRWAKSLFVSARRTAA
jgi:UDP:flavonoid glycosyltransferase YjiC (YdhE family)/ubiquinone/menaquinone biosynthesis C-methylase UbiE